MSSIIKNKILHINNFNILLLTYKQLLIIFKDIEDLIDSHYMMRNINKYQKNQYYNILLDIKFSQCKRHIEYFKFKKLIRIRSMPLFNNYDIE
jgi:hypothetical protein